MTRIGGNPDLNRYATRIGGQQVKQLAALRLPPVFRRHCVGAGARNGVGRADLKMRDSRAWKKLAHDVTVIEQQLCEWEQSHPEQYRRMPWYEAREAYKANRPLENLLWWEVAGAVSAVSLCFVNTTELAKPMPKPKV